MYTTRRWPGTEIARREKSIRHSHVALAALYKGNPGQFLTVARQTLDLAVAREVIAEFRNEGYVEEQCRGMIRFTPRGYEAYTNEPVSPLNQRKAERPNAPTRPPDSEATQDIPRKFGDKKPPRR